MLELTIAFLIGAAFGFIFRMMNYQQRLLQKGRESPQKRTTMYLGGSHFYILPEAEYLRLSMMYAEATQPRSKRQADAVNDLEG